MEILEKSGIKGIIDEYKNDLERSLQLRNPSTAYDAAREAIACVMALPEQAPEIVPKLKTIAFGIGADIDEVLFAGGIYFRDAVLRDVGGLERDQLA